MSGENNEDLERQTRKTPKRQHLQRDDPERRFRSVVDGGYLWKGIKRC